MFFETPNLTYFSRQAFTNCGSTTSMPVSLSRDFHKNNITTWIDEEFADSSVAG